MKIKCGHLLEPASKMGNIRTTLSKAIGIKCPIAANNLYVNRDLSSHVYLINIELVTLSWHINMEG